MNDKNIKRLRAVFGEGRYQIRGAAFLCGEDINCCFIGGDLPHIGAASLAVYEPERDSATVSTICAYGHRDDCLSADCAKKISIALKCTAAVSVGIHIDNAAPEELKYLCDNFEECRKKLLSEIKNAKSKREGEVHGRIEI